MVPSLVEHLLWVRSCAGLWTPLVKSHPQVLFSMVQPCHPMTGALAEVWANAKQVQGRVIPSYLGRMWWHLRWA